MNSRVGALSPALRKSIRLRSRGPYRRSMWPGCRARIAAERGSQPAMISALPATAAPLLRPRSSSARFNLRQSSSAKRVVILHVSGSAVVRCHLAGKCSTALASPQIGKRSGREGQVAFDQELMRATACAVVDKLNAGEVTPLDLLDVLERRIAQVDGKVNALPTLCFDRARSHAKALMKKPAGARGLLAGLPIPIKDLTAVEGVLTTQGSPIYRDNIPARSDILVERLEDNGGVIYAKSNTPEFGAGANTFNEVFGATRNPWDTSRSVSY